MVKENPNPENLENTEVNVQNIAKVIIEVVEGNSVEQI